MSDETWGPFGPAYPKIDTLFKRENNGKGVIIPDEFTCEEFKFLAPCQWVWTEKIDGTNIRVYYNGDKLVIGGRTDATQIPAVLLDVLNNTFTAGAFAEAFGSASVTFFGEGYGPKIQKGEHYGPDHRFVLFDIRVGHFWLKREDQEALAAKFGLDIVPVVATTSIYDAIATVSETTLVSEQWPGSHVEGWVGKPAIELHTRMGGRLVTKIKVKDFEDLKRRGA